MTYNYILLYVGHFAQPLLCFEMNLKVNAEGQAPIPNVITYGNAELFGKLP